MDAETRRAIPSHSTATVDVAWDGPANEARLKLDQDYAYYRRAYAWRDPDEDGTKKAHYRFIHHQVDGDGNSGAANVQGCRTGIGVLNGARGGTTIPAADRQGVYNHLARHMRDADEEPPELQARSLPDDNEYRRRVFAWHDLTLEERADKPPKLVGHAAVFDVIAVIGWFREQVARGAFKKTIKESVIKALWNHNDDIVLGSNDAGTLSLREDAVGLAVEIDPPSWASGYVETIQRGDVSHMSIGFRVIRHDMDESQDPPLRTIKEMRLFDVSPVAFPAFPETDISVRKALLEAGLDLDHLTAIMARHQYGLNLRDSDLDTVRATIDVLSRLLPAAPVQADHPAETDEPQAQAHLLRLRSLLELKDKAV